MTGITIVGSTTIPLHFTNCSDHMDIPPTFSPVDLHRLKSFFTETLPQSFITQTTKLPQLPHGQLSIPSKLKRISCSGSILLPQQQTKTTKSFSVFSRMAPRMAVSSWAPTPKLKASTKRIRWRLSNCLKISGINFKNNMCMSFWTTASPEAQRVRSLLVSSSPKTDSQARKRLFTPRRTKSPSQIISETGQCFQQKWLSHFLRDDQSRKEPSFSKPTRSCPR